MSVIFKLYENLKAKTYHRLFRDKPLTDFSSSVGSNSLRSDCPRLVALAHPCDVPIVTILRIRPPFITIGGITLVVIVSVVDIGDCGNGLLELATLIRVQLCDACVVDSRCVRRVVKFVLIVIRCRLETLRDLSLESAGIDLSFKDINFGDTATFVHRRARMVGSRTCASGETLSRKETER